MPDRPRSLPPGVVDAAWLALLAGLVWAISGALVTRAALDTDAVNLALAIERIDIAAHQPHPPGYLGYVLLLRAIDAITPLAPLEIVALASRLLGAATVALVYAAGRALADRRVGLAAAALVATSPLALYYAVDGQTHAGEMAVAAALLWRLAVARRDGPSLANAAVVGALLAIGGSLRPSFALIAVGPPLWIYARRWGELAVVAAVGAAGTAAWAIPTVQLAGGWDAYRAASDALIGMFARTTSSMSGEADTRMIADNRVAALVWIAMIAAPLGVAAAMRGLGARAGAGARTALIYAAVSAGPAALFFALVFIAEAGYALGLVPPAALAAAAVCDLGPLRQRLVIAGCAVAQLAAFVAAPTTSGQRALWIPSVSEIAFRQGAAEIFAERVGAGTPAGARVLVIADRGPTALYRQLPLLRPGTDVLFAHSAALAVHDATTLSLTLADDWIAAPGPVLLAGGPPSVMRVRQSYDVVAIGPLYSAELRAALEAASRCPIPEPDDRLSTPHLAPSCFAGRAIEIDGHRFEWGASRDEVAPR